MIRPKRFGRAVSRLVVNENQDGISPEIEQNVSFFLHGVVRIKPVRKKDRVSAVSG